MTSIAVFDEDKVRLGTVTKIVGEPTSRRWWAYAVYPLNRKPGDENRAGFRTQKAAMAWLQEQRRIEHGAAHCAQIAR